jgi:hypothetical protein
MNHAFRLKIRGTPRFSETSNNFLDADSCHPSVVPMLNRKDRKSNVTDESI